MRRILVLIGFILIGTASADDPFSSLAKRFNREITVQLFEGLEGTIGVRGYGVIECYRGTKIAETFYITGNVKFRHRQNGIEIDDANGNLAIGLAGFKCTPRYDSSFVTCNGRAYRGYLKCRFLDLPMGVQVLNMVDMEDYLKGVLPAEIGDRIPEEYEAVKAQAVAARTYAVWKLTDKTTTGLLSPTVADQVYSGLDSEKEFLSMGVDETCGELMIYKGSPIAAYYHAVCGGRTAPVENIWPEKQNQPYLEAADDRDFCSWAKTYSWTEVLSIDWLKAAFEKYYVAKNLAGPGTFNQILDIKFMADNKIGRIKTMIIKTPHGDISESSDRIRWALGRPSSPGAILPSTKFNAFKEMQNGRIYSLRIVGLGNGHGVGMCQCGAIGRSRAGKKYDEILKYYYKRIKLAKLY